jgi:uncharacterized protein YgiB involved in biofilm formation
MRSNNRRRVVTLSLLGASTFALMACQPEDKVETTTYSSVDSCIAAGTDAATCEKDFAAALAVHQETAPRYDALAVCEEEHGVGQCEETAHAASSTGSAFMPFFMGYMMGNMLSNNSSGVATTRAMAPKPLYSVAGGGYASADGALRTSALSGKGTVGVSSFKAPAATATLAPMSRATVSSRGGFSTARGVSAGG